MGTHRELQQQQLARVGSQIELPPIMDLHVVVALERFFVSPLAAQMIPVPLAVGDTGVRSVVSVQLSASSGTAGNFGLTQ
jgi:hypothetical protein